MQVWTLATLLDGLNADSFAIKVETYAQEQPSGFKIAHQLPMKPVKALDGTWTTSDVCHMLMICLEQLGADDSTYSHPVLLLSSSPTRRLSISAPLKRNLRLNRKLPVLTSLLMSCFSVSLTGYVLAHDVHVRIIEN